MIAEVHSVSDRFRDRILAGAEVTELKRLAFETEDGQGRLAPLMHQAVNRIAQGQTTLEELFRVVGQV